MALAIADILFHFLHLFVIVANLTFWMSPRTLRFSQVILGLTAFSWFGFGIFYGWGYCFLTDWHWQIKAARGETDLPLSYIDYLLRQIFGRHFSPEAIGDLTLLAFCISVGGCLWQTFRSKRQRKIR